MSFKPALLASALFIALPSWATGQLLAQAQPAAATASRSAASTTAQPVAAGMSIAQVQQMLGQPAQVDTSTLNGAEHQRLTYNHQGQPYYVYTRNGVVTFVQRY